MSYNPNKYPRWDNGRGRGPPASNDSREFRGGGFHRRNDGDRSYHQSGSRGQEYRDWNQGDRRYGGDANIDEPWRQRYQGPPAASNQARRDHASGHYGSRQGQDGVVVAHSAALVDKHTFVPTESAAARIDTTIFPVQTLKEWKTLPLREKLKSQIPQNNQNLIRSIPQEWYEKNPDLNACPGDLIDTPLMDLKMKAAERTLAAKIKEFDNITATQMNIEDASGSECESEDSLPMMGAGPWPAAQWQNISKQQLTRFVQALPHFLLLNLGFHFSQEELCCCPCSNYGNEWRSLFGLTSNHGCNRNKPFKPNALIGHLESGGHSGGNVLPQMVCHYLKELYKGFYAGERKRFDHEGLHQAGKLRDEIVEFKRRKMERFKIEAEDKAKFAMSENQNLRVKTEHLEQTNKKVYERFKELAMKLGLTGDIEKLEVDPVMMNGYTNDWKNLWRTLKTIIGNFADGRNDYKKIKVQISQIKDFKLQRSFNTMKFRRALLFDKEYELNEFQPFLQPLDVTTTTDQDTIYVVKKAKKVKVDVKTKDAGGPSRMFYEAVWLQLNTIAIEPGGGKIIQLFDESFPAGSVPTTDESLLFKIANAVQIELPESKETADLLSAVEHDEDGKDALDQAKLFYRGIGHIMASCLGTNNVIAPNALPQLFRNVIIRNIKPTSSLYSFRELMLHAKELLNEETLGYLEQNDEIEEDDPELRFKLSIERHFIDTRTIALQSIRQGLTLNGLLNLDIAKYMPLEAVNRLTIGRLNVDVEEVISSFKLDHEWDSSKPLTTDQYNLLYTIIPEVIREKHNNESSFLASFLQWCTGQKYIPYKDLAPDFEIEFDFTNDRGEESSFADDVHDLLPTVKTCANYIVLPFSAYGGSKEIFQKRLETAIEFTSGIFDAE